MANASPASVLKNALDLVIFDLGLVLSGRCIGSERAKRGRPPAYVRAGGIVKTHWATIDVVVWVVLLTESLILIAVAICRRRARRDCAAAQPLYMTIRE